MRKGLCSVVPRIESRHAEHCNESAREIFEVDIVIHASVSFHFSKVDHPNDRIDVHE